MPELIIGGEGGGTPGPPEPPKPPVPSGTDGVESQPPVPGGTDGVESQPPVRPSEVFQTVTYGSFILTFCLAGFAAIAVFRKISKTLVSRFSVGAKTLSVAFLVIAFNGFLGTYLYNRFLNGESAFFPLSIPIMAWLLVGPAIAVVLNSLLTRENAPDLKKIVFDSFAYVIIFGCVVASQIPSLKASEPLVFSFLGALFIVVPIIRFSTSLKATKVYHP